MNKLKTEKILKEGYGNYFGFGKTNYWASATAGLLHVWNNFDIISSYEIPGFEKGNIIFENDAFINVGLFEINLNTREKKYRDSIAEKFALYCEEGKAAHYSQYKICEVLNNEEGLVLISIAYQPSKKYKTNTSFNGPKNRLLLFNRSNCNLLKVIAENYNGSSYSDLFMLNNKIIFTEDDNCFVVDKDNLKNKDFSIPEFIPIYADNTRNILAGSFKHNYVQVRNITDLKVTGQIPEFFNVINYVNGYDDVLFLAINDNKLQIRQKNMIDKLYEDEFLFDGVIETIAFNNQKQCFVALAGAENKIITLSSK